MTCHDVVQLHVAHVDGRSLGAGPVVAVLTDRRSDMAAAARAAGLAAAFSTLLIAAAAVHSSGLSLATLLRRAGSRRPHPDSVAVVGRVPSILHAAGAAHLRSMLVMPAGADGRRALPVTAVRQLVDHFSAVAVVTACPLRDPTCLLRPGTTRFHTARDIPGHPYTDHHVTF